MEIVFVILCMAGGLALDLGIAYVVGKTTKAKKLPNWAVEIIAAVLVIAGLFLGCWFADNYKQSIANQQYEQAE